MEFSPEKRIQSAAQLQTEVKRAIDFLAAGPRAKTSLSNSTEGYEDEGLPSNEGEGYVVMLVESKASLQNVVRERLKSKGYRVLVISDPNRALARFSPTDEAAADCVVFSAAELGGLALEAFNQFATDEHTSQIPSILLVDRRQSLIIKKARRGPNRKLLALPLKVRQLRAALKESLSGLERRDVGQY